nr:DUF2165 family protein [Salipiger mucosus]
MLSSLLPRTVVMTGLAAWMTIAVLNNLTDQGTNLANLETMLTMRLLSEDQVLGNGLEWRAWGSGSTASVLYCVIAWQLATAAALWWGAAAHLRALLGNGGTGEAATAASIALSMFAAMWLVFLCGGLWFGYWIKQGPIQGVHFTLLILSVVCMLLVNQPVGAAASAQRDRRDAERNPVTS